MSTPRMTPAPKMIGSPLRARRTAGRMRGGGGPSMAKANTALHQNTATVRTMRASPMPRSSSQSSDSNDRPWRKCCLMFHMPTQIHARHELDQRGRQLNKRSFTPVTSRTIVPAAQPKGASHRREAPS